MKASSLRGKEDGPFVQKFRQLHDEIFENSDAQRLIDDINSTAFEHQSQQDKHQKLEETYMVMCDRGPLDRGTLRRTIGPR